MPGSGAFHAAFHLDRLARVHDMNMAARIMLERGDLVTLGIERRLRWIRGDEAAADAAFRLCLREHVPTTAVVHDSDDLIYRLHLEPVNDAAVDGGQPGATLTVRDTARAVPAQVAAAQRVFHLSPGEASLIESLLIDRTLEDHAAARGSSRETTRKQLAHIFRKVGVSRQAALVGAVWTLPLLPGES